jgi:hypothetical protein
MRIILFLLLLSTASIAIGQQRVYVDKTVGSNPVKIDAELLNRQPELVTQVMSVLEYELNATMNELPTDAVRALQAVPIWIERATPNEAWVQYHFSRDWLTEHGYNPEKEASIEIVAEEFVKHAKTSLYPLMTHLASAYHQRVLGLQNQQVLAAFGSAVSNNRGSYNAAEEYFSVLSELYFLQAKSSDYRIEKLKAYDPQGFDMIKAVWKVTQ